MATETLHDRYDLLRPLARGGMAMVHLAREVDTGREVALKRLELPEGARLDDWRLRFQQEFHTAARLRHPNLVATWDYADGKDGVPFFTMEFLPGPGLEELIGVAPDRLTALLPGLLQALAYLHHQGLVHCDLKPENVRLGADGTLRLMDLGLITRAGQYAPGIQGTFPYLPPEVIRRAPVDRRSDLYALGAVLYHLLAGKPPFQGDLRAVLTGHLERDPAPLRQLRPEVPEALEALVMKLLAKDPLARFQSADEVLRFLGQAGDVEDDQTLFHPPLIGRQLELAELDAALTRARSGACEEVWLTGDADVGHLPLLEEFCCRAQLAGANVLRATFRPRMAPFEGLRPIVRGLVALARGQAQEIAHLTPVLARVLPELGAASMPENADLQQEKVRLFDALTQLARLACADTPVVMAFADAHFAEPAWREWLEYARRNAPALPLLVTATHTGEPDLDLDPGRTTLELSALGAFETHEACRSILGQSELAEGFTDQVHRLTGGHPMRLEALLRRLATSGHLRRRSGEWVLPEQPLTEVIATLDPEWAIEQGLKNLPALARAILDTLLVRGRESTLFDLAQIVSQLDGQPLAPGGVDLFDALRALEDGGWVVVREGDCALAPERDREDLLGRLAEARRLALHAAIATALEPRLAQAGEDPVLVGELAAHALAAGDERRGPRFALAAAQRRSRLFDLEGAESLLAAALELIETVPELDAPLLLSLHRLRADVARTAGDRRVADQAYQRAIALAAELNDPEALAALANGLGRLRVTTGHLDEAERLFKGVLDRLSGSAQPAQVAQATTMLGRLALTRGDLAAASAWVQRALEQARAIGDRPLQRENMAQLGYLYVATGGDRAGEGLGLLFEALQMTEKDEAKLELNACYALLGNAHLLLGRFVEAKLAYQRNCDLCAEIGAAPHDEATAFMRRATVELALGDYRGARKSAAPAAALARMVGNKGLVAQVRLLDGLAALYQGDYLIYQDAVQWVEEAISGAGSDYLLAMWHTCRAEAEGFLGAWSSALSSANQALEVMAALAGHEYRERAEIMKGEALMRLGLFKPARQALEAMAQPLSEALQARLLLAKARLESVDGKRAFARTAAERALALAQRAGVVPVAAECCLLLARLAEHRDEALSLSRKALLDAEVCGHPALEAEALYQASVSATRAAQADYFISAAEEAWKRAIGSMNPNLLSAFGGTEERRPLAQALARREAEGYRLTASDQAALLDLLAQPPEPDRLFTAVAALGREAAFNARVAIFWEGPEGRPIQAYGVGLPFGGAATPEAELEAAGSGGEGLVLVPLKGDSETPWGAVLVAGVSAEAGDRLAKLLPYLAGALWAARQFQQGVSPALERVVPQAAPAAEAPAGWPRAID